jgi:hypothetical protein
MPSGGAWELAGTDYTYFGTLLAAARRLSLTSCRVTERGELAGTDYTYFGTLRAAARRWCLTSCQVAERGNLAGNFTNVLKFWETIPNFGNCSQSLGKFGKFFPNFRKFSQTFRIFSKFREINLGDIPASEQAVTEFCLGVLLLS